MLVRLGVVALRALAARTVPVGAFRRPAVVAGLGEIGGCEVGFQLELPGLRRLAFQAADAVLSAAEVFAQARDQGLQLAQFGFGVVVPVVLLGSTVDLVGVVAVRLVHG